MMIRRDIVVGILAFATLPAVAPANEAATEPLAKRRLRRSEKNQLRIGIKRYFRYDGDKSDPRLAVVLQVVLDKNGNLEGHPVLHKSQGGTKTSRIQLFEAGKRAIISAAEAGYFNGLPKEKHPRWKRLNIVFTIDKVGFSS